MSVAKGILFGVKAVMRPVRVKTAASFTAEGPWNQGHQSPFKLEKYRLILSGSTVTLAAPSISKHKPTHQYATPISVFRSRAVISGTLVMEE